MEIRETAMSSQLRTIAARTVAIVDLGGYRARSGRWVDLSADVSAAVAGTRLYLPDEPLQPDTARNPAPRVEVTGETSLAAARRIGGQPALLVFASARNPGGGFRTGARAQEEDIARASALHACLAAAPAYYAHHRAEPDLRYSDRVIYSPAVPVFRDDTGELLEQPYPVAMLTAAAPNLRAIHTNQPQLAATVPGILRQRALRVLRVAAAHGHRQLVLGAWGCGVFGNTTTEVANAFHIALHHVDRFDHIVFAVFDHTPHAPTRQAFAARFGR